MKLILTVAVSLLLVNLGKAQTFLFNHNTGLPWSAENNNYLHGSSLITTHHLSVILNRNGKQGQGAQEFFIFDLRSKRVVFSLRDANRDYYWPSPSKTGSFVLGRQVITAAPTEEDPNRVIYGDNIMSVYRFNQARNTWSRTLHETYDWGHRTFEGSWPPSEGYFVKAVNVGGRVHLQFFRY